MAGESSSSKCTIGVFLTSECDSRQYSTKRELLPISGFTEDEKELISWRSDTPLEQLQQPTATICHHHWKSFLDCYKSTQKNCCDPFDKHETLKKCKL